MTDQIYRYSRTAELFIRLLGLVYFCALGSFAMQIDGLVGRNGVVPMGPFIEHVARQYGTAGWLVVPSLFWFSSSDTFVQLTCFLGAGAGLMVACGYYCVPLMSCLWLVYLSVVSTGNAFMGFQWDILLLETGWLAIFLFPMRISLRKPVCNMPSLLIVWLLRLLAFKLMFMSGCVKVLSGDVSWRNLTAMQYHYETQPIPNPLAWLLFQLPASWHKFETGMVLFIEILVPFLLFAPRKVRIAAGMVLVCLQLLIIVSGNYAYFNWLTIAICLCSFDDQLIATFVPRSLRRGRADKRFGQRGLRNNAYLCNACSMPVFLVIGMLNCIELLLFFSFGLPSSLASDCHWLLRLQRPFHLVNSYGLFAVMTTTRPEIIVEGSMDGNTWKEYSFRFKSGALFRAPSVVAPCQPRLDWQMWFAALGSPADNEWFLLFVVRLLQGSPQVSALLESNPFPHHAPLYVRAVLYDYHFTTPEQLFRTGNWWWRDNRREYLRPVSLEDLVAY